MKEPKIDNHFGDPEVQEYIAFKIREALAARDEEWREKIEKKSVDELLEGMGDVYKDFSVQVAYKEGHNRALDDLINSMK